MLNLAHIDRLREGKVLLAFSGGVDSTALFHLLLENEIEFDIAHVNYRTRASSDAEALSAETLALTNGLICHTHSCPLTGTNFEHRAREERYRFFAYLMEKHAYRYLLTAHQLNDRLEWLLMQMCRGSGLPELLGIRSIDSREGMMILRPLLEHDRQSIETYLHERNLSYHCDESNADERYTRNYFRHRYSAPLMREYSDAIRRSFRYLEEDNDALIKKIDFKCSDGLYYVPNPPNTHSLVYGVDILLKSLGYVMRSSDKERLKKERGTIIVGRAYIVWVDEAYTFVAAYHPNIVMDKGFKEECRRLRIEPKLRGFLFAAPDAWETMRRLKDAQALPRSG